MMRRLIISTIMIASCITGYAKKGTKYRHMDKLKAVSVSPAIGDKEMGAFLSTVIFKGKFQNVYEVGFTQGDVGELGLSESSIFHAGYLREFTITNLNNAFFAGLGTGGFFAYEKIKNKVLEDEFTSYTPGVSFSIFTEFYFNDNISLNAAFKQNYRFNSKIGDFFWYVPVGVRYVF
jgi:hypothetical protein